MIAWNHEVIEVGEENVSSLTGVDIAAVQFAEGGAMGYHGGVFIVTTDAKIYYTCYLKPSPYTGFSKSMSLDDLRLITPQVTVFLQEDRLPPRGWQYSYLGAGNHLFVREDYKKRFDKSVNRLEQSSPNAILYNLWMDAVLEILHSSD